MEVVKALDDVELDDIDERSDDSSGAIFAGLLSDLTPPAGRTVLWLGVGGSALAVEA